MPSCPHTSSPQPHEIVIDRGLVSTCRTCGGLVKICPHCSAVNREAARFCVQCGHQPAPPASLSTLLPPGQIREGLKAAVESPVTLHAAFGLPAEAQPVVWDADRSGAFLFSARDPLSPARVDLLDHRQQRNARGTALCDALPPSEEWLARPLVSPHGIFLATTEVLHALAAHGYDAPFHPIQWRPGGGRSIVAVGGGAAGEVHLLLREAHGRLSVATGNGQSGDWRHRFTIDLDAPVDRGGFLGVLPAGTTASGDEGGFWVLSGETLLVVDEQGSPILRCPLPMLPQSLLPRWRQRLGKGQFDPLLLSGAGGAPTLAFPHAAGATGIGVGIVQFEDPPRITRPTPYEPTGWVDRDWDGYGLLTGKDGAIERFNGSQRAWHLATESRVNVPALSAEKWLIALADRQDGPPVPGKPRAEVLVTQRGTEFDVAPRVSYRVFIDGTPVPGLRPLLLGDTLLMATRIGARDYGLRMAPVLDRTAGPA